ncbi:MAG: archaea-specific SMC-related protein [Halapricum sp.]
MSSSYPLEAGATVSVQNIGGIEETAVDLRPGVNVLSGRNATNRTSFLQAIMAALGSDDVSIKGDADEGEAVLELGEHTYRRQLTRQNDTVVASGEPYLDDPELADLFAFLLESNEARRTVATEGNLRDLIMRPVDLEEIKAQISELETAKQEIDDRIESIEDRKRDLPDLEEERTRLEEKIAETREELSEKEQEIEVADADVESQREDKQELEERLESLRKARNDLEDIRYDIDTERESIQSLKEDRSTLQTELEALPETPQGEIAELDEEISTLRDRRRRLDSEITSLQNTIQFNEEMLEGERTDVQEVMDDDQGSVTDELLPDEQVVCWTCGSEVDRDQIEETIDQLRSVREEKLGTKRDIADSLDELKADKEGFEQQQRRREEYESQLDQVENELRQREERLESLQDRRAELEDTVKDLEAEVESLEAGQFDEILDLHREANQLEYDVGRYEDELESIESEIATVEDKIEELSDLREEREEIQDELTDLRTRVERLEEEAIEAFNEHMEEVLGTLDYDNLDRIWIERVQREVRDGRRKAIKTFFELHVIRSTPSGTTYEDTIDHLSESEREVTGLVFALAGYLVHEVYEKVPFMLLDSLEAIDSGRIAELVEYFSEFADFLVVALLPEDAQALDEDHYRVEAI